jgi:phosphate transport system substrate-binding protein
LFYATNSYYPILGVLQLLLENGADVGIKDKEGRRAFDYAEGNKSLKNHYLREIRVADDTNLDLYHPWSSSAQLPYLDSLVSLRINSNHPKLDGATSTYPLYAAVVNDVYEAGDKTELQQYLICSRTAGAYENLIRGKTDIIFVLQPSDEQLKSAKDAGVELLLTPIAKDAFVFFVNSRNPVSGLTIEQIRDIYRKNITNWQEVGGNDKPILPYQRQENSGSQTAMIKEVMNGENLPPPLTEEINRVATMFGAVYDVAIAQYRNQEEAIGYSFRFFTEEMMRDVWRNIKREIDYFQLMIDLIPINDPDSQEKREKYQNDIDKAMKPVKLLAIDGIAPSEESIRNGTYPFTVDVYAVVRSDSCSNPRIQELIDWMLSPQGQELIEKTGYIGVAANRNEK